jgi:hypothetical protein
VGYFGTHFLARCAALGELACVQAIEGEELREHAHAGGWRHGSVAGRDYTDPGDLAAALVAATGAPALAMYVFDSDFATVHLDSPQGVRHWFYLDPEAAMEIFEEFDDPVEPPPLAETVAELRRWAAEAGLTAGTAAELAAAVFSGLEPSGGDVQRLFQALGVPDAAEGGRPPQT